MKGNCLICDTEMEVKMCCDGKDCGCKGLPIEPPLCSSGCYEQYVLSKEEDEQRMINQAIKDNTFDSQNM